MEHLKSECIEVYTFDSVNAAVDHADSDCGPPFPPAIFDRILVDAPCSALGQRPCYVNKISVNQLKSFPVIQHKLLLTAVQLLKPGGVLVYSTCTITREENEDQVSKLLAKCPCIELVSTPFKLGGDGLQGSNLTEEQRSMVQRFDPTSTKLKDIYNVDTIGFFIAKFVKK
uniref:SAM-dependent MTase RsmB/NOP-type domain-containing protein n=2 Tax=Arion vulgaris TaxID=1028688 RepID=A0A0B6ZLH7_9EUPU